MKKKTIYWIVGIFGFFLLIGIISDGDDTKNNSKAETTTNTVASTNAESTTEENWYYEEQKDEMTDKIAYFAAVKSQNSENFDFPYEGGSNLSLTIRKSPKFGTDVYITISKGQFNSAIDGIPVMIRFDEDKAFNVSGNGPSDGSSNILFLSSTKSLISKIKNAKTMKIDVEFFQEGHRTFTFNVAGLKWEH